VKVTRLGWGALFAGAATGVIVSAGAGSGSHGVLVQQDSAKALLPESAQTLLVMRFGFEVLFFCAAMMNLLLHRVRQNPV